MANDIKSLNDLFKQTYGNMFHEDITVADTAIARKLYPDAEKLENGALKIGERSVLPDRVNLMTMGRRHGKSFSGGLISPSKLSEGTDEGEDKE
jgi:hypothetical protein